MEATFYVDDRHDDPDIIRALHTSTAQLTGWINISYREIYSKNLDLKYKGHIQEHEDERCSICLCDFESRDEGDIIRLGKCEDHYYHIECIENCRGGGSYIKCPICGIIYGVITGDMPPGSMSYITYSPGQLPLSGYERIGTIEINYHFRSGRCGAINYRGTSRTAYLPHNNEGIEVLRLLILAFKRKLTFTIGTSVTTGRHNCVIWNGIHHKTSVTGGSSCFGYPDKTYLFRVREELAAKGIV